MGDTKSDHRNKVVPKASRYFHYLLEVINHSIQPVKNNPRQKKKIKKTHLFGTLKNEP